MDYKYDIGIELLLAQMSMEDRINAAESLYQLEQVDEEEEEEEAGLSLEDESLSQEEMDENEETLGSRKEDYCDGDGDIRYGTESDLLAFVNQLSNMQAAALQNVPEEMGVLLNRVRSLCMTKCLSE